MKHVVRQDCIPCTHHKSILMIGKSCKRRLEHTVAKPLVYRNMEEIGVCDSEFGMLTSYRRFPVKSHALDSESCVKSSRSAAAVPPCCCLIRSGGLFHSICRLSALAQHTSRPAWHKLEIHGRQTTSGWSTNAPIKHSRFCAGKRRRHVVCGLCEILCSGNTDILLKQWYGSALSSGGSLGVVWA